MHSDWQTYFLAQVGATAALTGLVFVALSINHPFTGTVRVAPEPLEMVLSDFETPPSAAGSIQPP